MKELKNRLDNQAVGLLPILLFMILDNYISYFLSFVISLGFSFICIFLFNLLTKNKIYQFLLLPTVLTFFLYFLFLNFRIEPTFYQYSSVLIEMLFVVVLAFTGFTKSGVINRICKSDNPLFKRTQWRTTLNEFYFVSQIIQNVFTLHLFVVLVYMILPVSIHNPATENFLNSILAIILGVMIIIYEQLRIMIIQGKFRKEIWLPVLSDEGKVIGCVARSVSQGQPKKYYHPIVRIAVMYKGMLYLVKGDQEHSSAGKLDYPYQQDVLFRRSIDATVKETLGRLGKDKNIKPRFQLTYRFENEQVKQLVYLYTLRVDTEEQLKQTSSEHGKLWTVAQIGENLQAGLFSEYFDQEFSYLKSTVLLAESFLQSLEHTSSIQEAN